MTRSEKLFLYASGLYLLAAAAFGILNRLEPAVSDRTFAYSHFYLLGFVSMAFFGLGYYLFPRLNRSPLRFPKWKTIHLVAGNLSLVGLVLFRLLEKQTGGADYRTLFIACVVLQAGTLAMFVVNIWATLTPRGRLPETRRSGHTQPKTRHRLPDAMDFGEQISADMLINDVMRRHPRTQAVFARHFGIGCAGCPAQAFEPIALACRLHDADVNAVLDDLNAAR